MKKSIKLFHWLPRIICILAILFVSLFALDSFSPDLTIWQQLLAFFMHLIPTYVLIIFLIVAWKRELIGGIILTLIGIGFSPFLFNLNYKRNHFSVFQSLGIVMTIALPFIIVGILFIVSYIMKKNNLPPENRKSN
ncbi:MAG: hypothetical protein PHX21_05570 [bacterium]|nr:hypothetical protein [bacterium]